MKTETHKRRIEIDAKPITVARDCRIPMSEKRCTAEAAWRKITKPAKEEEKTA
jgi:hypothetical protein